MSGRTFVDTNVLIYAYDTDAGDRHERAMSALSALWASGSGAISTQVLQEFYVNVTRKIPHPLEPAEARAIIATYQAWPVESPDVDDVLAASDLAERYQLSFWDALIVRGAVKAGAAHILSEDFGTGRTFEGIAITNPFA